MFKNLSTNVCQLDQAYNVLAAIESGTAKTKKSFKIEVFRSKNIKALTTWWHYLHLDLISSSLVRDLNLWMSSWRKTVSNENITFQKAIKSWRLWQILPVMNPGCISSHSHNNELHLWTHCSLLAALSHCSSGELKTVIVFPVSARQCSGFLSCWWPRRVLLLSLWPLGVTGA